MAAAPVDMVSSSLSNRHLLDVLENSVERELDTLINFSDRGGAPEGSESLACVLPRAGVQ